MYRCLHGTAPPYLMDSCTLTAEVTGRQHLRSATQRKLVVPRYRLNSFGHRRFSVAGPSTWNSLPDSLRDPELSLDIFKRQLKTYIFAKYWWQNVLSALEIYIVFVLLLCLLTHSAWAYAHAKVHILTLSHLLGSISPNRISPNPILPNLFMIGGPTTTTCFVVFCFFDKLCFVIHHFFCTMFLADCK